jgi:hypothetical protein
LLELLERFPVCCDPVKIPEPFEHKGRWCVQLPAKLSLTGKRQQLYYATETDAKKDIKERFGEALEHGRSVISTGERQMVAYARQQLGGDLRLLPEIIAHWRATGTGSVTPITVSDAVSAFQAWRIPKVSARTAFPTYGGDSTRSQRRSRAAACTRSTQASSKIGYTATATIGARDSHSPPRICGLNRRLIYERCVRSK